MARLRNHCCSGKTIIITYSEWVSVALGFQHVMSMRHVVICGLPGSTIIITYSEWVSVALGFQHVMSMRHVVICGLPGSTAFFYTNGRIF